MSQLERNKAVVQAFCEVIVNERNPRKAADLYMGDRYIQHDHGVADGKEAFVAFLTSFGGNMPNPQIEIKRMIAEDDLVAAHFNVRPNRDDPDDAGTAAIDIFRVENEKIVEHWTVHMPVPTEGDPVNNNTIF
jgi:predicted SnoaL-like aldol condensation-catalyzing enzyme